MKYQFKLDVINHIQFKFEMSKDKESIQVTIRVRPLSDKQKIQTNQTCLWVEEHTNSICLSGDKDKEKKYTFDSVCDKNTQDDMFEKVGKKSAQFCMEGYNCTIFAYGQTGAGKTYTMMGVNPQHQRYFEERGLIPRTLEHLFACIDSQIRQSEADYNIKCSFIEIYNEQVMDLLNKTSSNLSIREDLKKGVYVEGVSEQNINNSEDAMEILRKGSKGRHVGSTHYNEYSSRSHSVFTMEIQSLQIKNGIKTKKTRQFHFIDLAGSERTEKSYGERLKEGCSINKSLHVLSNVIKALGQASLKNKKQHVNYRDSKLTFLLKDSLDGNSKTHLIANISPSFASSGETSSTLRFARQVKLIKVNKASINEDSIGSLEDLKNQIRRLRSQLVAYKNREIDNISNVKGESEASQGSGKMVEILHKYVDEELQKQTKVQEQLSKIMSENDNLQKGIKQYSDNEIHLRMIITIYEDKLKRLQEAQESYQRRVSELENTEEVEILKDYFTSERQQLLQENEELKQLSSSSKLIKSLLAQLKVYKGDQGKDMALEAIINKNSLFLQQIKESISAIEPMKKEEKFSQEEYEDLEKKNEELSEQIEKVTIELLEAKETIEENQNILKESIDIQISLEDKIKLSSEKQSELEEELIEMKNNFDELTKETEEKNRNWQTKQNQLMIQISQKEVQISELKNDISMMREKHNFNEVSLKEKIETLSAEKEEHEQLIKDKIQEIYNLKNEIITLQNDYEKVKDEHQSEIKAKDWKISEFQETVEQMNSEKSELKNKMENLRKQLQTKIQEQNQQALELSDKLTASKDEIKTHLHELQREKQLHLMLKEKYQTLCKEFEEEKSRYEVKHDQLMKMIEENKKSDSETSQKLSEIQLELIKLQDQKNEVQTCMKKEIEQWKDKHQMTAMEVQELHEEKEELHKELAILGEDNKNYKDKNVAFNEELSRGKRKLKETEEEVFDLNEKLKLTQEQNEKIKEKQKQLRVAFNEQKNQIYGLKKNSEVEIQSQKELYRQKCDDYAALERQHNRSKENYEKSLKQAHKQVQIKEELFLSNEESIKKTMGSLLVNKQNKISQLTSMNESLTLKNKQYKEEHEQLTHHTQTLQQNAQQMTKNLHELTTKFNEAQSKLQETEQQMIKANDHHMNQIEELQIKNNEEIDEKNAQLEHYLMMTDKMEKEAEIKAQTIEQLNKEIQKMKEALQEKEEIISQNRQALSTYREEMDQSFLDKENQLNDLNEEAKTQRQLSEEKIQNLQILVREKTSEIEALKSSIESANEKTSAVSVELQTLRGQLQVRKESDEQFHQKYEEGKQMLTSVVDLILSECALDSVSSVENNLEAIQQKVKTLCQENEKYREEIDEITREKDSQIEELENQLETIAKDHTQTHQMLTKKYDEQMKDMEEHNKIVSEIKQRNERLLEEMKCMDAEIRKKSAETSSLEHKLDEKQKLVKNMEIEFQNQLTVSKSYAQQIKQENQKYEELMEKLNEEKQLVSRINQQHQHHQQNHEMEIIQLNQALKQKEDIARHMEMEISLERQRTEELKKYIEDLNMEKERFSRERQQMLNVVEVVKGDFEETKNQFKRREAELADERNKAHEEIRKKQQSEAEWKKCVEEWEQSLNEAQVKIKTFKRQISKEKQTNKNFRGLIENAECQINQLKLQLSEKEVSYKKLLEKVSRNEFKGCSGNETQRLTEMLEKSRMELVESRKQIEDQRKINKALKLELAEKEDSIESLKANAEEYCRRQQEQMSGIQSDYLKIEEKYHFAERQLSQYKEELSAYKIGSSRAALKIEELEESSRKMSRDIIELQRENDDLKKDCLRTGMDERQKVYMNRIKEQNNYLKRELDKTKQLLMRQSEEKAKLKSEKRYGKDSLSSDTSRELEKRSSEIKHLQDIISEACNILGIKRDQMKSKYDINRSNLVLAIRNLTKDKHSALEKQDELEEEVMRLTQKLTLLQQKQRNSSRFRQAPESQQRDNLSKQIRTKLTQASNHIDYQKEDKIILKSMDQNKNQYPWDNFKY